MLVRNKISEILISKLLLEKNINVSLTPTAYGVNVNIKDKSVDIVEIIEKRIEFPFSKSE
jgi:hypothetical protein